MTQPIVYKHSQSIALLTLLGGALPAVVSIAMLYTIAGLLEVSFVTRYVVLSVLLAILSPLLVQQPDVSSIQMLARRGSAAAGLLLRWVALLAILLCIGYVTKFSEDFSRRLILTWAVLTPVPLLLLNLVFNEVMRRVIFSPGNARTAVFAGYTDVSVSLAKRLRDNPEICIRVAGFFDDRSAERLGVQQESELLGGLSELAAYVKAHGVDVIFVALPMRHVQRVLDLLDELHDTTASIYYVPDVFIFDLIQSRTGEILGMPVVAMCETPFFGNRGLMKRMMDLSISSLAVLVLAPLLLVIALLVKLTSPGPVIFKQRRYGLDGQEIHVRKFRTMSVVEDGAQIRQATRDDGRVTRLGRILRRYSLDELPQFFNVIDGSMSLVGPRPHAVAHNEEYRRVIKGYMIRHKVLPGMTGLAQVSGCRGETRTLDDMKARIVYDLEYLRSWSPLLDLKIIARTAVLLFNDHKAY